MEMGIPTWIGVNQMNTPDFRAFSAGIADLLLPELHAVRAWYERVQAPQNLATFSEF